MTLQVLDNRKRDLPVLGTTAARRAAAARRPVERCRRAWTALALLSISLGATPAAAQHDCNAYPDWDDIEWFRGCLEQQGQDEDWVTEHLSGAAWFTNNPAIVQLLLRAGADPQAVDNEGVTPLHLAAWNSNPVVTAHLLAAGADPNALDNEGYTPLHHAARRGWSGRVIARLLAAGADPLAESNDGRTPLHSALLGYMEGVRDLVSALVQGGGAANLTPLQLAALESDAAAVTSLLAEGADANVVDGYGWSPLHLAMPRAGPEVVSALLEAGADPNAQSVDGLTALHLAARHSTSAVVADLLRAGADPNAEAGEEEAAKTPLHLAAAWNDDPSVVLALLEGGASAAKRDGNGVRAVDFARYNVRMTGSAAYPRLLVTRPTALVAGRAVTGNLQSSDGVGSLYGHYDEWSYSARAGQHVVITMDSDDVDALLVVLRDDGSQVARDDDGGTGLNARVEFRAPVTGRYTIVAASRRRLYSERPARYTLRLEQSAGDAREGPRSHGPLGQRAASPSRRLDAVRPARIPEAVACNWTRPSHPVWRMLVLPPTLALGSLPAIAQSGSEAVVCVGSERLTFATNPIRRVYTKDMEIVYRIGAAIGQRDQIDSAPGSCSSHSKRRTPQWTITTIVHCVGKPLQRSIRYNSDLP